MSNGRAPGPFDLAALSPADRAKAAAARAAVDALVRPGQKLGLGTGSTARFAIERVAERFGAGELPGLLIVPTSLQTRWAAQTLGLTVTDLNDPRIDGRLDLALDGADEVDPALDLIKGGGAAHFQEKIIADAAEVFAVFADEDKLVPRLGTKFPIPVEIHADARASLEGAIRALGGEPTLRLGLKKIGPVITDNGHVILDVRYDAPFDAPALEAALNRLTGVLENGLFCGRAAQVFVGSESGAVRVLSRS